MINKIEEGITMKIKKVKKVVTKKVNRAFDH